MERRVVGESRENLPEPTPRGRMLKVMGGPGKRMDCHIERVFWLELERGSARMETVCRVRGWLRGSP